MWEITFDFLKERNCEEALNLCSINERFDSEPEEVRNLRASYVEVMDLLVIARDKAWRSEAGRNYSIAITELENSCMRAIKWAYSK